MAAVWKKFSRVAAHFNKFIHVRNSVTLCRVRCSKKIAVSLASAGIAAGVPSTEAKLEVPECSSLSTEYLIKSASTSSVEHANTLISYVAIGLDKAEKQYAEALFALVVLMEYKLQVLGHRSEEERIWTLILEARALVNKLRQTKQDLEMMMMSAVNMVNAAAEIAYMAGEEFSGSCAGDRLTIVEHYLKQSKLESEKAEQRLREAESKTVEIETKHAEEQKRKKEKAEKERDELEKQKKEKEEKEKSDSEGVIDISSTSSHNDNRTDEKEELIT